MVPLCFYGTGLGTLRDIPGAGGWDVSKPKPSAGSSLHREEASAVRVCVSWDEARQ